MILTGQSISEIILIIQGQKVNFEVTWENISFFTFEARKKYNTV